MLIFGITGILLFILGSMLSVYLLFLKLTIGIIGNRMPLIFLAVLSIILGIQFFALGFIAEFLASIKGLIKK